MAYDRQAVESMSYNYGGWPKPWARYTTDGHTRIPIKYVDWRAVQDMHAEVLDANPHKKAQDEAHRRAGRFMSGLECTEERRLLNLRIDNWMKGRKDG
jgi:hypothetical protein